MRPLQVWCLIALFCTSTTVADVAVYVEGSGLSQYWQSWSWGGSLNFRDQTVVNTGSRYSMSYTYTSTWAAINLFYQLGWHVRTAPSLNFWFNTGASERNLLIFLSNKNSARLGNSLTLNQFFPSGSAPANTWVEVVVPLNNPKWGFDASTNQIFHINIVCAADRDQGTVYFDKMRLVSPPFSSNVTVNVNFAHELRSIDTDIYGVNWAVGNQMQNIGYTANRKGGNAETRFNWKADINNRASDYFFQNVPNNVAVPSRLPFGSSSDMFAQATVGAGAKPVMQLTTIGWVAKDDRVKICSFNTTLYGAQQKTECTVQNNAFWCLRDCGDGVWVNGSKVVGNNPYDTSFVADKSYSLDYIEHLRQVVGGAARYFTLDNEAGLWHTTHRDVHPNPVSYDKIWNYIVTYGSAIKAAYPDAMILGPSNWGWCDYWTSAQDGTCTYGNDFNAHERLNLTTWLLVKLADYKNRTGVQLIDYFDIHYYPASLSSDAQILRSVKSLYDPYYVDESWIGVDIGAGQLQIIPRFKSLINTYCPWIKFAISEHSWGDNGNIATALANAEVLAIFAREGLDMGLRFLVPSSGSLVEAGYKLFLNYDGTKTPYSGVAVSASSTNTEFLPVYAAKSTATQKLYIVLFNKDPSNAYSTSINVTGVTSLPSSALSYVLDRTGLHAAGSITAANDAMLFTMAPYTARLLVFDTSPVCAVTFAQTKTGGWSDGTKDWTQWLVTVQVGDRPLYAAEISVSTDASAFAPWNINQVSSTVYTIPFWQYQNGALPANSNSATFGYTISSNTAAAFSLNNYACIISKPCPIQVNTTIESQWTANGHTYSQTTLKITNMGSSPVANTKLQFYFYGGAFLSSAFGLDPPTHSASELSKKFTCALFNLQPGATYAGCGYQLAVPSTHILPVNIDVNVLHSICL